jgi:hypothetical protein
LYNTILCFLFNVERKKSNIDLTLIIFRC